MKRVKLFSQSCVLKALFVYCFMALVGISLSGCGEDDGNNVDKGADDDSVPVVLPSSEDLSIEDQSFTVYDSVQVGYIVGTVEAVGGIKEDITFEILSGNRGNAFEIDPVSGELSVSALLNFQTKSEYEMRVEVSDGVSSSIALVYVYIKEIKFSRRIAIGTYKLVLDQFGASVDPNGPIQVIASDTLENGVIFKDMFGHGYDVLVSADPITAEATVIKQVAWDCDNLGCAFGIGQIEGNGSYYCKSDSCTLSLDLEFTVEAGSFGTHTEKFEKL